MKAGRPLDEAAWLAALRYWVPLFVDQRVGPGPHVSPQSAKLAVFTLDLLGPGETGRGGSAESVAEACGWTVTWAVEVLTVLCTAGFVKTVIVWDGNDPVTHYHNVEAAIVEAAGVLA